MNITVNGLNDQRLAAPPWTSLRDLKYAAEQYEKNTDELDETSLKWINQLITPGSSLGGARPKAEVVDKHSNQWVAKVPSKNDDSDIGLWELVVNELAIKANISVPNAIIKKLASCYYTYLPIRFKLCGQDIEKKSISTIYFSEIHLLENEFLVLHAYCILYQHFF